MPLLNPTDLHNVIDTRIKEQKEVIRSLRSQRNSASYICQLPQEILSMIIRYAYDALVPPLKAFSYPEDTWWKDVTSVCRHWYYVALSTPQIWTRLDLSRPNRAWLRFKRSKLSPLTLMCNLNEMGDNSRALELAETVLSTSSRLEDLDIQSADFDSLFRLLKHRSKDVPLLRRLRLVVDKTTDVITDDHLFWREMPRVEFLHLQNVPMPVTFPNMRFLTQLHIGKIYGDTAHLTIHGVLQMLRETPRLQYADLSQVTADEGFPPPDYSIDVVPLPDLKLLRIYSDDLAQSVILDYLSYPCTTCVNLVCTDDIPADPGDLRRVETVWTHFYEGLPAEPSDPPYAKLDDEEGCLSIEVWTERSYSHPSLSLDTPSPLTTFFPILLAVPFNLTKLSLSKREDCILWRMILPYFRNIKVLILEDTHLGFLDLLAVPRTASEVKTEDFPFPYLTNILFLHYDFSGADTDRHGFEALTRVVDILNQRSLDDILLYAGSVSLRTKAYLNESLKCRVIWDMVLVRERQLSPDSDI